MAGTTDTVPAKLTPGEFVIKRESAKMLGLPFLRKLNAVSDNAAHDNIDALIAQAELSNMKPMVNGGNVTQGYENGGGVEKEGLLAGLLSMISPKRRRQMDYEAMVPQDMRNAERVYYTYPDSGNDTDTLLEFENSDAKEREAINRLVKERDRIDAYNEFLYGIVPQALGEQGTVAESVPLRPAGRHPSQADVEAYYKPIAGFYHPDMEFTYEDQLDRAKRAYEKKQQGGLTGYQNGDVVKDDDPLQIDMRMADPSIYNRSVISGKFGDERGIPDAWMQPATEPMPTPEQEAKFLEELNKIKIQQLIEKLKEEQIFNPTEIGGNMDGTSLKQAIIKEKTNSSGEKWSNFLQTLPYIENNQSLQFPPSILNRPPLPK